MKTKVFSILTLLLMTATGAWAEDIEVDGGSRTISSDVSSDYFYMYEGTLTIEKGATVTLSSYFYFNEGSNIYLHGTLQGSVGSGEWNDGCAIHIYLNDGAKYTLSGFTAPSDACQIYYGYDAATDGNGTVSVKNGAVEVTSSSTGYKSTTYTFTASPNSGYKFKNWTKGAGGEVLGTDASINVTCEQNGQYQVYANFETAAPATYAVTANSAGDAYWSTFYTEAGNYQAPEGTQVFAVNLEGTTLTMTEISDRIVKSGEGVVLKNTTPGSITMTKTETAPAGDFSGNRLTGTMVAINTSSANDYYVLGNGSQGVGFYKLSSTGTIGANKAYLTYSGAGAREFFPIDENGMMTGIDDVRSQMSDVRGEVYDLQGRQVAKPTKGLYIVNGKKVFINK